MPKRSQHVVPLGNGWAVQTEGRKTATVITTRQSEAISYAKDIAKYHNTDVIVHGRNGKIRVKNSYGNNPPHDKG